MIRAKLLFCIAAFFCPIHALSHSFYTERPVDTGAVYFVKENFRIHGDGIGDDAPALQAAINQVEERSGFGILFIPEGTYRLGSRIDVWRGIRLIGYGESRPLFVLGENTPGYQEGNGNYMIQFRHNRPPAGEKARDANNTSFYCGISNIDMEIRDGNPAAIAVRFHIAQHSSLEHMEFRIGNGRAGVEDMGNEIEDCRFIGGDWGIKTGRSVWQSLVLDCVFAGQRIAGIETEEAGMTSIRNRFRESPCAVKFSGQERLFMKDCRFEHITRTGLDLRGYFRTTNQVNLQNVQCSFTPVVSTFPQLFIGASKVSADAMVVEAPADRYVIDHYSHGLHIEMINGIMGERKIETDHSMYAVGQLPAFPGKDYPDLPPQSTWINVRELGAKGDGITDDTEVFRKAIDKYKVLFIPMGKYRITKSLELRPESVFIGLHCRQTLFMLEPGTPGFTDENHPGAMLKAPEGGTNIITGIGFYPDYNPGAIALKWMAGGNSYLDDVHFLYGRDAELKGKAHYCGLWVTNGGGGTFKNIWSPDNYARHGLMITNTATPGRTYELSIEHHTDVEVKLENVWNWEFYALQTEENHGSEYAMAIDIQNCRNLEFANTFIYRIMATVTPHPYAIRVRDSKEISFRGIHSWGGGFPFDHVLYNEDAGTYVAHSEIASLSIR